MTGSLSSASRAGRALDVIDRVQHDAALRALGLQNERRRDLERRRMASELHNELGQLLNAARMQIGQLHRERGSLSAEGLDRLDELLAHAAAFARRFGHSLRPPALDLGLVPALEALCVDFRVRSGLGCTLTAPEDLPLPDFVSQTVYRVAEEALANVIRHARATRAALLLTANPDGLVFELSDDGVGLPPMQPVPGLRGTPARVGLLGGEVEWGRTADGGTRLRLLLPAEALTQDEA